ncbi:MAG: heat-inducible transcription repressor HrcA [Thermoclostridium sp.]|nr:heat-inducible transcription repressor HrcA [Thermoclostridium sp.]
MFWDDELNERKMQILKTLIDDYVQTAQPVGSRTISRKYELGLSSATIRNEMADLEEMGYITQPHTSAGRVPSDKGYRFYVDHLMQAHTLAMEEIAQIRTVMELRMNEINALIHRASNIISMFTGYTSIAISPSLTQMVLKTVQIVPVDEKKALVVVVSSGGIVKNRAVRLETETTSDILLKLSNFLHEKLNGQTTQSIQYPTIDDIVKQTGVKAEAAAAILDGVVQCLKGIDQSELIMNGTMNLLNHPEFNDLLKVREVLELFNDQEVIKALMNAAMRKSGLSVQIGKENPLETMHDCSLITASYSLGETEAGALGIIGPTRMSYAKVVSSMRYIQKLINSEILRILSDE